MPLDDIVAELEAEEAKQDPFAKARRSSSALKAPVIAPSPRPMSGLDAIESELRSPKSPSFIRGYDLPPGRPITTEALQSAAIPEGSIPTPELEAALLQGVQIEPSSRERVINYRADRAPAGTSALGNVIYPAMKSAALGLTSLPLRLFGDSGSADLVNREAQLTLDAANRASEMQGRPTYLEKPARGALGSLATVAASGPFGTPAVIGVQAAQAGNQAYTQAIDAGKTPGEAGRFAATTGIIEGGVTALFNKFGLGGLESQGFKNLLAEYPEEIAIAGLQQVNTWAEGVDPQAVDPDTLWQVLKDTLAQTTLAAGGAKAVQISGQIAQDRGQRQADQQSALRSALAAGAPSQVQETGAIQPAPQPKIEPNPTINRQEFFNKQDLPGGRTTLADVRQRAMEAEERKILTPEQASASTPPMGQPVLPPVQEPLTTTTAEMRPTQAVPEIATGLDSTGNNSGQELASASSADRTIYGLTSDELEARAAAAKAKDDEVLSLVFPEIADPARRRGMARKLTNNGTLEEVMAERGFAYQSPEWNAMFMSEDPQELRKFASKLRSAESVDTPDDVSSLIAGSLMLDTQSAARSRAKGETPNDSQLEAEAVVKTALGVAGEKGMDPKAIKKSIAAELQRRGYRAEDLDIFNDFFGPVQSAPRPEPVPVPAPAPAVAAPTPLPISSQIAPTVQATTEPGVKPPVTAGITPPKLAVGQRVRLTTGPKKGAEATISSIIGNRFGVTDDKGDVIGGNLGIAPGALEVVAARAAPAPVIQKPSAVALPAPQTETPSLADIVGRQESLQVPEPLKREKESGLAPRSKDVAVRNQVEIGLETPESNKRLSKAMYETIGNVEDVAGSAKTLFGSEHLTDQPATRGMNYKKRIGHAAWVDEAIASGATTRELHRVIDALDQGTEIPKTRTARWVMENRDRIEQDAKDQRAEEDKRYNKTPERYVDQDEPAPVMEETGIQEDVPFRLKGNEPFTGTDVADLAKHFPKGTTIERNDGGITFNTPGGAVVRVETVGNVATDTGDKAAGSAHVTFRKDGRAIGIVRLVKGETSSGTAPHELYHIAHDLGLITDAEHATLLKAADALFKRNPSMVSGGETLLDLRKRYESLYAGRKNAKASVDEERIGLAREYWKTHSDEAPDVNRTVWQKISDFFKDTLASIGVGDASISKVLKSLDTGAVFERAPKAIEATGEERASLKAEERFSLQPSQVQKIQGPPITMTTGGQTHGIMLPPDKPVVQGAIPRLIRRYLTHSGDLPADVAERALSMNHKINGLTKEISFVQRDYNKAMKEAFGRSPTVAQREQVNEVLAGNAPVSGLPPGLVPVLSKMRGLIDGMSREAIRSGLFQGQTIATVNANLGTYLNRTYKVHSDPAWAKKVPEPIVNRARSFIRAQNTALTNEEIDGIIGEILAPDLTSPVPMGGLLGSKKLGFLKQRKNIPVEIRDLMGENRDPLVNFANSFGKMAAAVESHKFLQDILINGKGVYFHDAATVKDGVQYTTQIAGDGSKTMAPLNGLYTTPEIAQAFADTFGKSIFDKEGLGGSALRLYAAANGMTKYAKTIGNFPTGHVRNFVSNFLIATANGHWNAKHAFENIKDFQARTGLGGSEKARDFHRRMVELGVIGESVTAGELRSVIEDAGSRPLDQFSDSLMRRTFAKGKGLLESSYELADSFWKINGFFNERAALAKARPNLSEEQLDYQAAERITDTYPTYEKIAKVVRDLRRIPFIGTFTGFTTEIIRNTKNIVKIGLNDLQTPGMRALGAKRLVGISAALAIPSIIAAISRAVWDIDDDDEESTRRLAVAPWSENSTLMWLGKTDKGESQYADISWSDPWGFMKKPVMAAWRGETTQGAKDLAAPYVGPSMLTQAIMETVTNSKQRGGKVYQSGDTPEDKAKKSIEHLWKSFEPGTVSMLKRIYKADAGIVEPTGREYSMKEEVISAAIGLRLGHVDIGQSLKYKSYEISDRLRAASANYNAIERRKGVTQEEIAKAAKIRDKIRDEITDEASVLYADALRLGLPPGEARIALKAGKVPVYAIGPITEKATAK